jgi:hypothetical protein
MRFEFRFALKAVLVAGCMLGGFAFADIAIANFLPFAIRPSDALTWGAWIAVFLPWLEITQLLSPLTSYGTGLPAFGGLILMMACLTVLRKERIGFRKSIYDSLTLIAPSILIVFELSIFRYYPNWINYEVTVFVGEMGLGGIITNLLVMEVSVSLVVLRIILGVRSRWGRSSSLGPSHNRWQQRQAQDPRSRALLSSVIQEKKRPNPGQHSLTPPTPERCGYPLGRLSMSYQVINFPYRQGTMS